MKNIFSIFKKELDKVFKFPRTLFSTLVLPGLIIFLIYAFMGQGLQKQIDKEEKDIIYMINAPESIKFIYNMEEFNTDFIDVDESTLDEAIEKVKNREVNALIYYDADFDQKVANGEKPKVQTYVATTDLFDTIASKVSTIIDTHRQVKYQELNINLEIFQEEMHSLDDEHKQSAGILAMILPILIMSFIFGSALSLGSDAIAGEKERGTLATILLKPISRSDIIVGKIASTSVITVLSALSSFVGVIASLPFAKSMFSIESGINYRFIDYFAILVMLLVLSITASSLLLITSTLAKDIKEATTFAMPIYLCALIIPILTMTSTFQSKVFYMIPIFNTILGFKEALALSFNLTNFLIILSSSLIFIALVIVILVRLFKSERILYSK